MPPQAPQTQQADPDFAKLSPGEQHAYLSDTDPDYGKLSPADQKAYLQHVAPTHGAGTPQDFAAEKTASGSMAPPLNSAWDATKYGMKELGGGIADIGKGAYDTFLKPPQTTTEYYLPPGILQAKRTGEGMYNLGKQAMQVPGAIMDLYHSPDPLGSLALASPRAAGQGVGMAAMIAAPEAAEGLAMTPVGRIAKAGVTGAGDAIMSSPIIGAPLKAFGRGFMRSWNGPEPTPPAIDPMYAQTQQAVAEGRAMKIPLSRMGKNAPAPAAPPAPVSAVPRPAPAWRMSPSAGDEVPSVFNKTAAPVNSRATYPKAATPRPIPAWKGGASEGTPVPSIVNRQPYAQDPTPRIPMAPSEPVAAPVSPYLNPKGVSLIPEPRELFPGEDPNYMASVPRGKLGKMAVSRKPGAGAQMQQLGQPIIYIPDEADYPGPRR